MITIPANKDPGIFETTHLSNGITLYHRQTELPFGLPKIACSAVVSIGGRDDPFGKEGCAHFFEHMPFRGTKQFPTLRDISYEIEHNGGYINAFTTDESTGYEIIVPMPLLEHGVARLADLLLFPLLRPEDIAMEREIIIEELRNKLANVQFFARQELFKRLLGNHPLVHAVIGTESALKDIDKKDLLEFHQTYYNAANINLFTAGNCDLKQLKPIMEQYLGHVPSGPATERSQENLFPSLAENSVTLTPEQYNRSMLLLGRRLPSTDMREMLIIKLFRDMLSSGMNSPLQQEIREKRGLAYNLGLYHLMYNDVGILLFTVSTRFQHMDEVELIFWEQTEKILDDADRFSEVKNMSKQAVLYREYGLGAILDEAIDDVSSFHQVISLQKYIDVLDSITLEDTKKYVTQFLNREDFLAVRVNCDKTET